VVRGVEVRLADREVEDRAALGLEVADALGCGDAGGFTDPSDAARWVEHDDQLRYVGGWVRSGMLSRCGG